MRKILLLAVLWAAAANAQHLSIGVIGGVPFTDAVSAYNSSTLTLLPTSSNFVVGPALQVNLPLNLRVEVDALYRPYSFAVLQQNPFASSTGSSSGSDWNFPVLLQYRFNTPLIKPFLEAGFAVDHLSNLSAAATEIASGPGQLLHQTSAGLVLGGGVDVKIPFVRLSGELRYTREGSGYFQQISNVNQAEVLFGVHF
jgi:hypothetical protein